MKLKIHETEVISVRIPGDLYQLIVERAKKRKLNLNDYVKNALMKYTEFRESNNDNAK